jgi:hypothetical protein
MTDNMLVKSWYTCVERRHALYTKVVACLVIYKTGQLSTPQDKKIKGLNHRLRHTRLEMLPSLVYQNEISFWMKSSFLKVSSLFLTKEGNGYPNDDPLTFLYKLKIWGPCLFHHATHGLEALGTQKKKSSRVLQNRVSLRSCSKILWNTPSVYKYKMF